MAASIPLLPLPLSLNLNPNPPFFFTSPPPFSLLSLYRFNPLSPSPSLPRLPSRPVLFCPVHFEKIKKGVRRGEEGWGSLDFLNFWGREV